MSVIGHGEECVEQLEGPPAGKLSLQIWRHLHHLHSDRVVRVIRKVDNVGVVKYLLEQADLGVGVLPVAVEQVDRE